SSTPVYPAVRAKWRSGRKSPSERFAQMFEFEMQGLGVTGEPGIEFLIGFVFPPVQPVIEQVLDVPEAEEIMLAATFDDTLWPTSAAGRQQRRIGGSQDNEQGSREIACHE